MVGFVLKLGKLDKKQWTRYILALIVPLCLLAGVVKANVYPCGYYDAAEPERYAGHGYHAIGEFYYTGLSWNANEVPVKYDKYDGTGPYFVKVNPWIFLLYVPILMGICVLGFYIAGEFDWIAYKLARRKAATK